MHREVVTLNESCTGTETVIAASIFTDRKRSGPDEPIGMRPDIGNKGTDAAKRPRRRTSKRQILHNSKKGLAKC